jgi:hypothetical protein
MRHFNTRTQVCCPNSRDMWHEIYRPLTIEDTAWSLPKLRELSAWRPFALPAPTLDVRSARRRKQSSQDAAPATAAVPLAASRPILVMHGPTGCGKLAALQAAYQLRPADVMHAVEHTVAELEESLNRWLHAPMSSSPTASTPLPVAPRLVVVKELPTTFTSGSTDPVTFGVLSRFVRAMDAATRVGASVPNVVFVHTVHDTHSSKVDLRRTYPSELLDHRLTQMFHCTATTERAIGLRLKAVAARAGKVCSEELIEQVAAASRGDMRQALLQMQWALLLSPRNANVTLDRALPSSSVLQTLNSAFGSPAKPTPQQRKTARGAEAGRRAAKQPARREVDVVDLLASSPESIHDMDSEDDVKVTPQPVISQVEHVEHETAAIPNAFLKALRLADHAEELSKADTVK